MSVINSPTATTASHRQFDYATLNARERYKLIIGSVVPRPIALVTTRNPTGSFNAAPFSFFNCLSADPPILALGVENHADMSFKDTTQNIRLTEEFTVNIVDCAMIDAMNVCAVPFPSNVDELQEAGLTAVAGVSVTSPYIPESPIAFECKRHVMLGLGKSREIILGLILNMHVRSDLVDPATLRIDQLGLDAVGRMGGHGYATTRDQFDLPTMTYEQWSGIK